MQRVHWDAQDYIGEENWEHWGSLGSMEEQSDAWGVLWGHWASWGALGWVEECCREHWDTLGCVVGCTGVHWAV